MSDRLSISAPEAPDAHATWILKPSEITGAAQVVRVPRAAARTSVGARVFVLGFALAVLASPGAAFADEIWTITPSLQLGENYTDNVFGTAHNRESDFITQITPGIGLSYATPTLKLSASYSVTGELYADHSDLDNFGDNQNGALALEYQPEERLRLRLAGYYARTNNPTTFTLPAAAPAGTVVVPTVETARLQTEQFTLSAGGDYRFTPRLSGRAGYVFEYLQQEGTDNSLSNTGTLGADYQLTQQDAGFTTVSVSAFDSTDSATSVSLLLGWRRQWSADLTTSVAAGPRVTDGTWAGAAQASATYQAAREWSATLLYSLGTGLAAGTTGAQNVSSLSATVAYQPTRELRFSASGGWTRTSPLDGGPGEQTTDAFFASVSASYQLTTWLTLSLTYQYSLGEDSNGDSIPTNQVILALTAAYPWILGR
jgi:predicted porin